uniref:Uncharacterized protein n=1 Tax=Timema poppense TaxID=170557 RepID=A0A7R9D5A3_TIMPO|nr:unnamed protein product [Timema poppensis]
MECQQLENTVTVSKSTTRNSQLTPNTHTSMGLPHLFPIEVVTRWKTFLDGLPLVQKLMFYVLFHFLKPLLYILDVPLKIKKSRDYGILVSMFFIANLCNNYAFNFNIPMPLHMIFRAGSLIANMIMGIVILRKKYAFSKYLSVFMISAGIVICTFVSGQDVVRIILLTVALFVSARMGIYQEVLYAKYGKHPREALFYTHLLPLPGFLIWYQSIVEHAGFLAQSEPFAIPILGFGLPKIYICINSVYVLTTECSSLTVTLVVTLRKFVSLLFSIIYFKNDFTLLHWTGTLLVFIGTLIFTEIVSKIINSIRESSKVKTN